MHVYRGFAPPVIVKENKRSPLLGYAGIVPIRNLVERLDIASVLDANISVLKRHNPYFESDHILRPVSACQVGVRSALNKFHRI